MADEKTGLLSPLLLMTPYLLTRSSTTFAPRRSRRSSSSLS